MSSPAIRITDLRKMYRVRHERRPSIKRTIIRLLRPYPTDVLWALDGVSFCAERGEAVGVIGSNGSGKSTLLRLIAGILRPTEGSVEVQGRASGLFELAAGFHPELSGRDNIQLTGALMGQSREEIQQRYESIIEFAELADFIDVPVKTYSSGMSLRLGFAVAIAFEPEVLLVDEVLAVADEQFQRKAYKHLERLQAQGSALFMVSHEMAAIERMCSRCLWLDRGTIVEDGPTPDVIGRYLSAQGDENDGA